ncbi:MAG TPA: ATP-binding protein [Gemmatimonadaceae bacterium]|nr:ATP-binding protein [Gemmatimonadaceae bacterium]
MVQPGRILRWIYIGRLSLATAIFLAAVFSWREADATDTLVAALGMFLAAAFTAASAWLTRGGDRTPKRTFCLIQALFDLALVTAIVHVTGGATSQFAALYVLVIVSASLLLPVGDGLGIAVLGISLYCVDVLWGYRSPIDVPLLLQLGVFGAVALSTAYLSARLKEAGHDREHLEAQLALARMQAEDVLRNIRSGIITVDQLGRLLYANPAAGAMLGFEPRTSVGQSIVQLLSGTAAELADALHDAVQYGTRVTRGEATITRAGRTVQIGLTTTTVESSDPPGLSATAIFQDISDNKRLEALRLRAERLEAVTELSASLAHEIKNPLASIRSAVEQLSRRSAATDDERRLSALIVRESDRLSRLLSEFLDFARVRVTKVERVDVGQIVRAVAGLVAQHPQSRGIAVECVAPLGEHLAEGDEDLLHRALFNVVLNAVQASPDDGRVTVEVETSRTDLLPRGVRIAADAVLIRVTDQGGGIAEEIRDRVFDPFFTTKAGGTGLGLPIVHRAIEAHRGIVLLDSSPGGTRFTIVLPRAQSSIKEAA